MDIRKLQRAIVDGLEDVKAQDIQVYNTEHLSPLFERVIIASGTSNRQTKALASSVRDAVKRIGEPIIGTEGGDNGEWIIVDCGAAVAHIMQPAIREYYRLEEIWGGKPVKLKLGTGAAKGLPKASSDGDDEDDDETPVRPEVNKAAARKAAAPAKKAPAAGKTAPAKSPSAKAAPARKAPAAKTPAAKTPASKAPARKAAAKAPAKPKPTAKTATTKAPTRAAAPRKAATTKTAAGKAAPAKRPAARKTAARG